MDLVLTINDDAGAQKTDARDDLRRHAGSVRLNRIAGTILGHHHDERRTRAHDGVRTDARLFIAELAFIPDGKTEHNCKQDIQQMKQFFHHGNLPAKFDIRKNGAMVGILYVCHTAIRYTAFIVDKDVVDPLYRVIAGEG